MDKIMLTIISVLAFYMVFFFPLVIFASCMLFLLIIGWLSKSVRRFDALGLPSALPNIQLHNLKDVSRSIRSVKKSDRFIENTT